MSIWDSIPGDDLYPRLANFSPEVREAILYVAEDCIRFNHEYGEFLTLREFLELHHMCNPEFSTDNLEIQDDDPE